MLSYNVAMELRLKVKKSNTIKLIDASGSEMKVEGTSTVWMEVPSHTYTHNNKKQLIEDPSTDAVTCAH